MTGWAACKIITMTNTDFKVLFLILIKQAMVYRQQYTLQDIQELAKPPAIIDTLTFSQKRKAHKEYIHLVDKNKNRILKFNDDVYAIVDEVEAALTTDHNREVLDELCANFGMVVEEMYKAMGERDLNDVVFLLKAFNGGNMDQYLNTMKELAKKVSHV